MEKLPYLPIPDEIVKALKEQNIEEELVSLGISKTILYLIRWGYARQLRKDVFDILSKALNHDILTNIQPEERS